MSVSTASGPSSKYRTSTCCPSSRTCRRASSWSTASTPIPTNTPTLWPQPRLTASSPSGSRTNPRANDQILLVLVLDLDPANRGRGRIVAQAPHRGVVTRHSPPVTCHLSLVTCHPPLRNPLSTRPWNL